MVQTTIPPRALRASLACATAASLLAVPSTATAQEPAESAAEAYDFDEPYKPAYAGAAPQLYLGAPNILRSSYIRLGTELSEAFVTDGRSEDQQAYVSLSFVPRLSFVNTETHWAWVGTELTWHAELTDTTKTPNGTDAWADIPLWLSYNYTLVRNSCGLAVLAGPRGGVAFPTSDASQAALINAKTSAALDAKANVPLTSGPWLPSAFASVSGEWLHVFGDGYSAPGGFDYSSYPPTAHNASSAATNHYRLSASYWLLVVGNLSLGNRWGLSWIVQKAIPDTTCEVQINTGCVSSDRSPNGSDATVLTTSTFGLSLGYEAANTVWFELGYDNTSLRIGEDGQNRSVFYSSDAQIYLSATLLVDAAVENLRRMQTRGWQ